MFKCYYNGSSAKFTQMLKIADVKLTYDGKQLDSTGKPKNTLNRFKLLSRLSISDFHRSLFAFF